MWLHILVGPASSEQCNVHTPTSIISFPTFVLVLLLAFFRHSILGATVTSFWCIWFSGLISLTRRRGFFLSSYLNYTWQVVFCIKKLLTLWSCSLMISPFSIPSPRGCNKLLHMPPVIEISSWSFDVTTSLVSVRWGVWTEKSDVTASDRETVRSKMASIVTIATWYNNKMAALRFSYHGNMIQQQDVFWSVTHVSRLIIPR